MTQASAYRFRDFAAVYAPGTVYLDAAGARALAKALNKVARSIETEGFADSAVGSVAVPAFANTTELIDIAEHARLADDDWTEAKGYARRAESNFWELVSLATGAAELARHGAALAWASRANAAATVALHGGESPDLTPFLGAAHDLATWGKDRGGDVGEIVHRIGLKLALAFSALMDCREQAETTRRHAERAAEVATRRKPAPAIRWRTSAMSARATAGRHRHRVADLLTEAQALSLSLRELVAE